jgi:hypothetical protein
VSTETGTVSQILATATTNAVAFLAVLDAVLPDKASGCIQAFYVSLLSV